MYTSQVFIAIRIMHLTHVYMISQGGTVVMACRSLDRANEAKADLEKELSSCRVRPTDYPHSKHGKLVVMPLDLADLASVHAFAHAFKADYKRLDVLVCNAGLAGVRKLYHSRLSI